jgi:hypothetical protein
MMTRRFAAAVAVIAALALNTIASASPAPDLSDIILTQKKTGALDLQSLIRRHKLTAVVFFSATCPCFAAHRARLAALVHEMEPRGVAFVIVDSERRRQGASSSAAVPETDLPILRDDQGKLARRLGAEYATETFVFDATGALRYRGGIDDDRKRLSQTPRALLRDSLLGLLAGNAPEFATGKTLGCVLRLL